MPISERTKARILREKQASYAAQDWHMINNPNGSISVMYGQTIIAISGNIFLLLLQLRRHAAIPEMS